MSDTDKSAPPPTPTRGEGKPYPTKCPFCDEDYERGHHRTKEAEDNCPGNAPKPAPADVEGLVARLRDEGDKMDAKFGTRLCDEAADLLERLKELMSLQCDYAEQLDALTEQNRKLREALEKIASGNVDGSNDIISARECARAALKE